MIMLHRLKFKMPYHHCPIIMNRFFKPSKAFGIFSAILHIFYVLLYTKTRPSANQMQEKSCKTLVKNLTGAFLKYAAAFCCLSDGEF